MIDGRNKVLNYEAILFEEVKVKNCPDKCLNLGSGMRLLDGFTNIDKYVFSSGIENYDIYQLPYVNESIEILFSAHALEHLPIRHAKMALMDWYRVLVEGGKLVLMVPDLTIIMAKLLDETLSDEDYLWLMYTLFGYQVDMEIMDMRLDHVVDHGQFHTCGFTKIRLKKELESLGFKILQLFSYDGWGTPSFFVEAVK